MVVFLSSWFEGLWYWQLKGKRLDKSANVRPMSYGNLNVFKDPRLSWLALKSTLVSRHTAEADEISPQPVVTGTGESACVTLIAEVRLVPAQADVHAVLRFVMVLWQYHLITLPGGLEICFTVCFTNIRNLHIYYAVLGLSTNSGAYF